MKGRQREIKVVDVMFEILKCENITTHSCYWEHVDSREHFEMVLDNPKFIENYNHLFYRGTLIYFFKKM